MTHSKPTRKKPPYMQKFLLYLILANFVLLWLYYHHVPALPLLRSIVVTALLIGYNLLLCRLVLRRARSSSDSYIVYPVVIVSMLLCGSVLHVYLIR